MNNSRFSSMVSRIAKSIISLYGVGTNKNGYGAWIDDKGNSIDVQFQDHVPTAEKMLKERGVKLKDTTDQSERQKNVYGEAMKQGWSRVVWYKNNLDVEYDSANVSDSSLYEVKSLVKDFDWKNITVELTDKKESTSSIQPRDALLFINKHDNERPPKPRDTEKKEEVQKAVEKSLDKEVEKKTTEKDSPKKDDKKEDGKSEKTFTDSQKKEWEDYKKEHITSFKNIKEYFDSKGGDGKPKEKLYQSISFPDQKVKGRRRKLSFVGIDEVVRICPECAENMKRAGIDRISIDVLRERSRIGYGWADLPKGWTQKSVKKFWNTLTGDKQHKVTECISRMTKHFGDGAGGFCAGLADMANPQGPAWRFGPRKKKNQSEKESSIALKILIGANVKVDINDTGRISPSLKNKANKAVSKFLKPTYFKEIPIDGLFKELRGATDLVVVQEDGTEWTGMLVGRDGEANFDLGYEGKLVSNATLRMTWHKMESGRYEVLGYVS